MLSNRTNVNNNNLDFRVYLDLGSFKTAVFDKALNMWLIYFRKVHIVLKLQDGVHQFYLG